MILCSPDEIGDPVVMMTTAVTGDGAVVTTSVKRMWQMCDGVPIRLRRDDLFARCACWRHMEVAIRPVQGVTECIGRCQLQNHD